MLQRRAGASQTCSQGEAVLAEVGTPFMLETTGLQVQATVSDLQYNEGQRRPEALSSS